MNCTVFNLCKNGFLESVLYVYSDVKNLIFLAMVDFNDSLIKFVFDGKLDKMHLHGFK